ncbi:MAG: Smr/MutS family protein [candidate division WOR-3 bacterium]|nr:Smr/MutS family protein [candidate division WOR-3 bacterium]
MYIPANISQKLELDTILSDFVKHARLEVNRDYFTSPAPVTPEQYNMRIELTDIYREDVRHEFEFSKYHIRDCDILIEKLLNQTEVIEEEHMRDILAFLLMISDLMKKGKRIIDNAPGRKPDIDFINGAIKEIEPKLDKDGLLRDTASGELKKIRKQKRSLESRQESIIGAALEKYSDILMNDTITISDNRIVLQVKTNLKNEISGILHNYSDTGKTAFIEPNEFVNYNNQLKEIKIAESNEIKRILAEIKNYFTSRSSELVNVLEAIKLIDKINTVSAFMDSYNAVYPELSDKVELMSALNPVLFKFKGDETVPFTLNMERGQSLLLTGPNMGGKTAVLKTLGLFAMLIHRGLPVTCSTGSKFRFYSNVFADIGDDQSVEKGVSTFASHIINYKAFAANADNKSIILLDEIGTGTSVKEGAGFAVALIEYLIEKGAIVIFTSHFDAIKEYALKNKKVRYASMMYDTAHDRPLYKIEFDSMGQSGVINLIKKYDFPGEIVERAENILGRDYVEYSSLVRKYEGKISRLSREKDLIEKRRKTIDRLEDMAKQDKEKADRAKESIDREYRQKKEEELIKLRRDMEHFIKEIRESDASKESIKKAKQYIDSQLEEVKEKSEEKPAREPGGIREGDRVLIQGGTEAVVEGVKGDRIVVNAGSVTMELSRDSVISRIERDERGETRTVSISSNMYLKSNQLDVRGMYPEDAILEVQAFIEKAKLSDFDEVLIIHGYGTGVLKQSIRDWLKSYKHIKEFKSGIDYPGGDGVTVIIL